MIISFILSCKSSLNSDKEELITVHGSILFKEKAIPCIHFFKRDNKGYIEYYDSTREIYKSIYSSFTTQKNTLRKRIQKQMEEQKEYEEIALNIVMNHNYRMDIRTKQLIDFI